MFVLASIVDITARKAAEEERRRLEDELRQSQKLEAVGTLAGGIAHDFNNILFGIVGYAELVGKSATPEQAADLAELQKAAARGRELIERILVFSRRETAALRPLEIGPTVEEAGKLLRAILPVSIDVRVTVDQESPKVLGDATSIHQVLMNLGTNAAHAMPAGGVLAIAVEALYLRDSVARSHPGLREGPYALLTVRDSGSGMPRAVLDRAFEPFYTTKGKGSGTGLGLSMVHSIVQAHGGAVELASEPGQGTTATCYFPALGLTPAEERLAAGEPPLGEGERVLLVEDEPSLASMSARRLAELGYRVTAETDAVKALATVRERPEAFDLVISDYLMPQLLGVDLAREIHSLRPALPIVLLTGFIENLPAEAIRAAGVRRVLKKPVTLRELGVALREVLSAKPVT
jgi:nitrogen-specific signal transduction histidine kinase/ActR/RegA family two-component response regulator